MVNKTYPKIKGCYECSQRRVSCDRNQPTCHKCAHRGLKCSGLGLRYRFEADVGARGKRVEKTLAACMDASPEATPHCQASESSITNLAVIELIPPWKEFLLSYFSSTIAPQMLAIDDASNEWRHLVLSVSLADDVVNSAVLAAAACHASLKSASIRPVAQESYVMAICGLQRRRDLHTLNPFVNCYNVLTILVLLVAAMATGEADFPPLFRMLKSAVMLMGEDGLLGTGDLGRFLLRQIQKFSVYAEPLLSEQSGIETVWARTQAGFECLQRCSALHPEHAPSLHNVRSQIEQAYTIYLHRALGNQSHPSSSIERVEQFRQTVEAYPIGCPGEHVLVWATFIVAAESTYTTVEHRAFFARRMQYLHQINGFGNIPKAIRLLERIWKDPAGMRWTSVIAEAQIFIM
ncbi:Zn(II)2Cys6 transcription factor [Aspergillus mulundensis]|uniref:Zn(2)-C6 fungal-type domain-containing protein n=1 Tax=Aspergillus mulundensis TaxID=1810919 RepID=A0A3D8SWP6_9EURO|nr:hypothetical protein DSM5745_02517 [Aspergillus mulundensis]RDW90742.1 hypothetical protein DSM5745_02517 [Aspergillus mulundensis]